MFSPRIAGLTSFDIVLFVANKPALMSDVAAMAPLSFFLSSAPQLLSASVAAVHATLSTLLQEQDAADGVQQAERDAAAALELALRQKQTQATLYRRTYEGLPVYGPPTPPMAPEALPFDEQLDVLDGEVVALTAQLAAARAEIDAVCTPSEDVTCGRSSTAAPNPWVAADGSLCLPP